MPDDVNPVVVQPRGRSFVTALLIGVAAAVGGAGGGAGIVWLMVPAVHPAGDKPAPLPKQVPPVIVELPRPFTANLRDSGRYVQLSLGIAVAGGAEAADSLKSNDVALRSAVLETLSTQSDVQLGDPDGKKRLRAALVKALNESIKRSGGEYQVVDVFFTAFVVQ